MVWKLLRIWQAIGCVMGDNNSGRINRSAADVRAERLAAELRANLKRRKDQARARSKAADMRPSADAKTDED
ncbi:hypothetical protein [Hyphomicrobium sulfonivorans]|uniref:hypothetical protein n=1 Tax=Hyphomicrobium sulfonivorans TaxID=121290 RepID=UPI00156D71A7|nr:hypothetical protein [Hyphomicrobium sulfonivorans]MBI1649525.1 hypothetical protein [Hyphomicrobium sulfonivorans]NSL71441.1 hypothetical protein [Hyphomicrobium sulfonivorans]